MNQITACRADWLRVVHELSIALHRPATPSDVARHKHSSPRGALATMRRAVADGQIVIGSRTTAFAGAPMRLTPPAMLEVGVAPLVYLAWAMPAIPDPIDATCGRGFAATITRRFGIYPVSPYLTAPYLIGRWDGRTAAQSAALILAQRVDAVIAVGDEVLLARPDVHAARVQGIPVSLLRSMTSPVVSSASLLWQPPVLVPHLSTGSGERR